jgi:signal transduction histidine kinase
MPNQTKARTIGETLRLVGSSEAFTRRVVIWTLPISIFIAVAFDSNRYGTSRIGWALAGILAHAFATLVLLGLRLAFLPKGPYAPKPAKTLIIFAIGAISRSLAIGQISVMLGLAVDQEFLYRAFAGALLGTLTLSVAALIAAILKEHDQTQAELASEREALIQARNSAQQLVEQQRLEIQQIVNESIEPALLEISENLKSVSTKDSAGLKTSANKISDLIDSRLRPLSASLHKEQKIEIPRLSGVAKKPSLIALPEMLTLRNVVSPMAIYLVLVVPNTTGATLYLGYSSLPVVMLAYAPLAVILSIFIRLPISNRPIRTGRAFALLSLVLAIAWTPAILVLRWLDIDIIERLNLVPTATLGTMIVGLLLTYSVVVDSKRISYESELRDANQELNLELNRTSQLIWHVRQRAAQTLHGSVQASLTAANMRILGAQTVDEELLEKVRQDLIRATESLTNLDGPTIDLKTSISDLVQLWQGVCEVRVSVEEDLLTAISANQVTSHCINEIVKEGVSNAIRHGHAKSVEISILEDSADSIQIEVSNDGVSDFSDRQGVGSQMLDEITMNWSRELTSSGVRLVAKVAANSPI